MLKQNNIIILIGRVVSKLLIFRTSHHFAAEESEKTARYRMIIIILVYERCYIGKINSFITKVLIGLFVLVRTYDQYII